MYFFLKILNRQRKIHSTNFTQKFVFNFEVFSLFLFYSNQNTKLLTDANSFKHFKHKRPDKTFVCFNALNLTLTPVNMNINKTREFGLFNTSEN